MNGVSYMQQSYFIQIRLAASKLTLVGHCVGSCKITFHSFHQSRHHQLKLPLRITQYNVVQITLLHAVTICVLLMNTPDDFMPSCLHTTVASSLLHQLYMSDTVLQTPSTQISTLPSLSICPPTRQRFPDLHSECEVHDVSLADNTLYLLLGL